MQYPLIIGEGMDIEPYFSLAEVQYKLEPWMAEESQVFAYDCTGRLLKLTTEKVQIKKVNFWGREQISEYEELHVKEYNGAQPPSQSLPTILKNYFSEVYKCDARLVELFNEANLTVLINALVNHTHLNKTVVNQQIRSEGFAYPIIISVANSYLQSFASLAEAETTLSVLFARDKLYRGFDATGRLLYIEPYKNCVIITLAEGIATHQQELAQFLKTNLKNHTTSTELKDELPFLLSLAK